MLKFLSPVLPFAILGALASQASATITINLSELFVGNLASNFGNATATTTGTNGMNWGIVVDTSGTSGIFAPGSYVSFNIATAGFLSTASGVTDDYYFPSANLTLNTSGNTESGGASGSNGTITEIANVPYGGATGIAQDQKFALIWFSTNSAATGDKYGFYTNAALTIPPNGNTVSRSSPFAGVDPVRPATQTIAPVPEPSSLVLLGTGALLLMRRRIRA